MRHHHWHVSQARHNLKESIFQFHAPYWAETLWSRSRDMPLEGHGSPCWSMPIIFTEFSSPFLLLQNLLHNIVLWHDRLMPGHDYFLCGSSVLERTLAALQMGGFFYLFRSL
jgi:hypothetical protein